MSGAAAARPRVRSPLDDSGDEFIDEFEFDSASDTDDSNDFEVQVTNVTSNKPAALFAPGPVPPLPLSAGAPVPTLTAPTRAPVPPISSPPVASQSRRASSAIPVLPSQTAVPASAVVASGAPRTFHVLLKSAQNLMETDFMSESDPYVTLELTGELHTGLIWRSKTIQDNNSPVWNENVQWLVHSAAQCVLVVKVFDEDDMGKDDFLGYAIVQLKDCDLASGRGTHACVVMSRSPRGASLTCSGPGVNATICS